MADLGKAYVQIMPSAKGISGSITKAIQPEAASAGKKSGNSFTQGMMKVAGGLGMAKAASFAIDKITEAVGKSTNPANYLLAQKYIQALQDIAAGDKTKTVYLPYEATNVLGSIGGIKDLFKE